MTKGLVSAFAECKTCGKKFDNYKTVNREAASHARRYKHVVYGELGYFAKWFPKQK